MCVSSCLLPFLPDNPDLVLPLPLPLRHHHHHRHCSKWPGITCRTPVSGIPADGVITGLDLASLNISYPSSGADLADIVSRITPLSSLERLNLSGVSLAGTVPQTLAGFETLQTLNLSSNPGLRGSLPELLGGLTSLKSFDISYSGISGSLPPLYAAMTALESFNAVGTEGLECSIPASWVLLNNLRTLNIALSGINETLPDWTDLSYLRKVSLAVARAADKSARRSAGVAEQPDQKATAAAAKRAARSMAAAAAGEVAGWSNLVVLRLVGNKLEGTVPASYSTLLNLTVLDLEENGRLTGPLPSLGKLRLLQVEACSVVMLFSWYF